MSIIKNFEVILDKGDEQSTMIRADKPDKMTTDGSIAFPPSSVSFSQTSFSTSDENGGDSRTDLYWNEKLGRAFLSLDSNVEKNSATFHQHKFLWSDLKKRYDDDACIHLVLPIDCSSTNGTTYLMYRSDLLNLDIGHIVLAKRKGVLGNETVAFMGAMMMFPEWDDFDRPSYAWPDLVTELIRSPVDWRNWRQWIDRYMTPSRKSKYLLFRLLHFSRTKMYLFFLCLAHVGFDVHDDLAPLLTKLSAALADSNISSISRSSSGGNSQQVELNRFRSIFDERSSPQRLNCASPQPPQQRPQGLSISRSKPGSLCSLLSLQQPSTVKSPSLSPCMHESNNKTTLSVPLTPTESSVLNLIECIRSVRSIDQVTDDNVLDKDFTRRSCRVGMNFQAHELPTCISSEGKFSQSINVSTDADAIHNEGFTVQSSSVEKAQELDKGFMVFKPNVLSDIDVDSYIQSVSTVVPLQAGDLVEAWKPSNVRIGGNDLTSLNQHVLGIGSFNERSSDADTHIENMEEYTERYSSGEVFQWKEWKQASRMRRLLIQQYSRRSLEGKRKLGVRTPVGVIIACENDDADQSASSSDTPKRNLSHERKVWIYDGEDHFASRYEAVRLITHSEDMALEVLHDCQYDTSKALETIRHFASQGTFRMTIHWAPQDINKYLESLIVSPLDIYKAFVKIRDSRVHWRKCFQKKLESHDNPCDPNDARQIDYYLGRQFLMKDAIFFYHAFFAVNARFSDDRDNEGLNMSFFEEERNNRISTRDFSEFAAVRAHGIDTKKHAAKGSAPNRWPSSLLFFRHNIYFIERSNTVCVCLKLEISGKDVGKMDHREGGVSLQVLPLSFSSYQYRQVLSPTALKPLSDEYLQRLADPRYIDFVLAMKDFAEQDMKKHPECVWYTYPSFLIHLISQPNDWKTWRKLAEKAAAGRYIPRRQLYLEALLSDDTKYAHERGILTEFPWDDSAPEPYDASPALDNDSVSKPKTNFKPSLGENSGKRKLSATKVVRTEHRVDRTSLPSKPKSKEKMVSEGSDARDHKVVAAKDISKISARKKAKLVTKRSSAPSPPVVNMTNLFWSSKFSLPCIFYGHKGDEYKDSFMIRPICCSTFHYASNVSACELDLLTEERLKMCNDDRTRDFALALLGFFQWETTRHLQKKTNSDKVNTNSFDIPHIYPDASTQAQIDGKHLLTPFVWPDFIYDLIVYREKWNTWKKAVERSMRGDSRHGARKDAYLRALIQDYLAIEKEEIELENGDAIQNEKYADSQCALQEVSKESSFQSEKVTKDTDRGQVLYPPVLPESTATSDGDEEESSQSSRDVISVSSSSDDENCNASTDSSSGSDEDDDFVFSASNPRFVSCSGETFHHPKGVIKSKNVK